MAWSQPPGVLSLSLPDLHVWRIQLDDEVPPEALEALSGDEQIRAREFRFPHLSRRFAAGRAAVRAILARYIGTSPGDVTFDYGPRGKPRLASPPANGPIAFNVSHSAGTALCVVSAGGAVGVDIEWIRQDPGPFDAIDRYFSPAECAALRALPEDVRGNACYALWTRKEAFLKARGDGLSIPLDCFDVSCAPGVPPRILEVRGAAADGRIWSIIDAGPVPGFAAAVVAEGSGLQLRQWLWTWPPDNPRQLAPGRIAG